MPSHLLSRHCLLLSVGPLVVLLAGGWCFQRMHTSRCTQTGPMGAPGRYLPWRTWRRCKQDKIARLGCHHCGAHPGRRGLLPVAHPRATGAANHHWQHGQNSPPVAPPHHPAADPSLQEETSERKTAWAPPVGCRFFRPGDCAARIGPSEKAPFRPPFRANYQRPNLGDTK